MYLQRPADITKIPHNDRLPIYLCHFQRDWISLYPTSLWCSVKKEREMHVCITGVNHSRNPRDSSCTSGIWCLLPWHVAYGCNRNMTERICPCHSAANVNIWRANAVSSQEMYPGIRGGWGGGGGGWQLQLPEQLQYLSSFALSCDVMEPTWLQWSTSSVFKERRTRERQWRWLIAWLWGRKTWSWQISFPSSKHFFK